MKKEALKIGKTYVVTGHTGTHHSFTKGDEVTYIPDDGTSAPRFKRKSDGEEQCVSVGDIAKKEKKATTVHNLHTTYDCKVDDHLITLRGDGSTVPFLKLSGEAYVYASDLRKMAKQLNKWAKGIEASGS